MSFRRHAFSTPTRFGTLLAVAVLVALTPFTTMAACGSCQHAYNFESGVNPDYEGWDGTIESGGPIGSLYYLDAWEWQKPQYLTLWGVTVWEFDAMSPDQKIGNGYDFPYPQLTVDQLADGRVHFSHDDIAEGTFTDVSESVYDPSSWYHFRVTNWLTLESGDYTSHWTLEITTSGGLPVGRTLSLEVPVDNLSNGWGTFRWATAYGPMDNYYIYQCPAKPCLPP